MVWTLHHTTFVVYSGTWLGCGFWFGLLDPVVPVTGTPDSGVDLPFNRTYLPVVGYLPRVLTTLWTKVARLLTTCYYLHTTRTHPCRYACSPHPTYRFFLPRYRHILHVSYAAERRHPCMDCVLPLHSTRPVHLPRSSTTTPAPGTHTPTTAHARTTGPTAPPPTRTGRKRLCCTDWTLVHMVPTTIPHTLHPFATSTSLRTTTFTRRTFGRLVVTLVSPV